MMERREEGRVIMAAGFICVLVDFALIVLLVVKCDTYFNIRVVHKGQHPAGLFVC